MTQPTMPMPQPGMQSPGVQIAANPAPEPEQTDAAPTAELNIRLPDPATTGAKPPEPKPEAAKGAGGEAPNVKSTIEQILKKQNTLRPEAK